MRLLLALLAIPLVAADVTGKWEFRVDLGVASGAPTFTFEQRGEKLTGTYSGVMGSAPLQGTVKGDAIEFTFQGSYEGAKVEARYSGTVESGGAMKGKCDYGGRADGTWTAKRAQ